MAAKKGRRKSRHRRDAQRLNPVVSTDTSLAVASIASTTSNEALSPTNGSKRKRIKPDSPSVINEETKNTESLNEIVKPRPKKQRRPEPTVSNDAEPSNDATAKVLATVDATATAVPDFPFAVDPDDHCESPLDAYRDMASFLTFLSQHPTRVHQTNVGSDTFCIYDPYYCNGAVIRNLAQLGFDNVYNCKEDCYAAWAASSNRLPRFDVLVTNPPYSDNHVERLLQFVTSDAHMRSRPWFLLLPTWVHKKDYYTAACTQASIQPFYLVPPSHRRYVYHPPAHFRAAKKSAVHVKSSPFVSMWYCWGGTTTMNQQLMQHYYDDPGGFGGCDLARSKSALRDLRRKR